MEVEELPNVHDCESRLSGSEAAVKSNVLATLRVSDSRQPKLSS